MEEKIDSTTRRLETLEQEMQRREREMDDITRDKALMQKDHNNLKNTIKGQYCNNVMSFEFSAVFLYIDINVIYIFPAFLMFIDIVLIFAVN